MKKNVLEIFVIFFNSIRDNSGKPGIDRQRIRKQKKEEGIFTKIHTLRKKKQNNTQNAYHRLHFGGRLPFALWIVFLSKLISTIETMPDQQTDEKHSFLLVFRNARKTVVSWWSDFRKVLDTISYLSVSFILNEMIYFPLQFSAVFDFSANKVCLFACGCVRVAYMAIARARTQTQNRQTNTQSYRVLCQKSAHTEITADTVHTQHT